MKNVEVWGRDNCGQCVMAKNLLKQNCVEFVEVKLDNDTNTVDHLKAKVAETQSIKPVAMLPQIFVDGEHVGSFNDLRSLLLTAGSGCPA